MTGLVILLPFTLYLHVFFDNEKESIAIFGFIYEHGFFSNKVFIWFLLLRPIAISLMLIWYFNTVHWWRYFIFIPIILWLDIHFRYTFYFPTFVENNLELFSAVFICSVIGAILILEFILFKNLRYFRFEAPLSSIFSQKGQNFLLSLSNKSLFSSRFNPQDKALQRGHLKDLMSLEIPLRDNLKENLFQGKMRFQFQIFDIVIVIILIYTPILYLTYTIIPEEKELYLFFGFKLGSYGFNDVSILIYYACQKLSILVPCCIWFITCKHWWRYAILSPIILTIFQIREIFKKDAATIDEIEIFQALPIICFLVLMLLLISRVVNYQTKLVTIHEKITNEIDELIEGISKSSDIDENRERLEAIKDKRSLEENHENLSDLMALRKELLKKIKASN